MDKLRIRQKNMTCNQKKSKSIETDSEQIEVTELAEKDFKAFTIKVTTKEK